MKSPCSICMRVCALMLVAFLAVASTQAQKVKTIASTVPSNGDVNPYGVAIVPTTTGTLVKGNILVSNFNASSNLQGTGTTIVQITPNGNVTLFSQIDPNNLPGPCPGGVGLTTALVALKSGWVIVGSLPTTDGMADTAEAGCLLVLDDNGKVQETFYGSLINGPWDMAAFDQGNAAALFVTNVLNGTVAGGGKVVHQGTVLRLNLSIQKKSMPFLESMTIVGNGFSERTDPAALVIGPTGVGLGDSDSDDGGEGMLYVADSLNNAIVGIRHPLSRTNSDGTGKVVSKGGALNDPLGLTIATDGNILTVNGSDGFMVETQHNGKQIHKVLLVANGAGALFGLTDVAGQGVYFVNDANNTLDLLPQK